MPDLEILERIEKIAKNILNNRTDIAIHLINGITEKEFEQLEQFRLAKRHPLAGGSYASIMRKLKEILSLHTATTFPKAKETLLANAKDLARIITRQ